MTKLLMQIAFTYILISSARQSNIDGNANEEFNNSYKYYKVIYENGHLRKGTIKFNNGTPLECFSGLYGKHGTKVILQTPNYPKNYPNNTRCPWSIAVPPNTKITIQCEAFNVLQGDFFKIYGVSDKISGNSFKSKIVFFGKEKKEENSILMEFKSDAQKTSTGFNCTVLSSFYQEDLPMCRGGGYFCYERFK